MKSDDIREAVKKGYGKVATKGGRCCCGNYAEEVSKGIGYSDEELSSVPDNSNLGLGCGNPTAHALLKPGETVLDLGSGAGFDCFIAADRVGTAGKVIGVDMTPEMLDRARRNAASNNITNVEFREGIIEELPVDTGSVDAVISNCVINLSPDKPKVFAEAYRVLRPGGRMIVSDIVLTKPLPEYVRDSIRAYIGCLSGALLKEDYLNAIKSAGFKQTEVISEKAFPIDFMENDETIPAAIDKLGKTFEQVRDDIENTVLSINVKATK